jgi:hypothetical protein
MGGANLILLILFILIYPNLSHLSQWSKFPDVFMGTDNSYPEIRLGSTNGNNIAIATAAGSFSSSAAVNDMVIRSLNRLILQSGGGNAAFLITTDNRIGIETSSNINNILQVGDGSRLRIAIGSDDYTIIGSKNVDDSANTCIYT